MTRFPSKGASVKLLLGAALIATAACSKKPPKELPPPPPTSGSTTGGDTGAGYSDGAGTGAVVPGSRADFVSQAGSDTVLFGTDMIDIDSEARATLDRQAAWLKKYPAVRVTLEGHADERGTREYNLALGDRRANSAKNYLASAGISASRISTISYGKERPVASGSDESAWAQNRRAVTVVPQ
ncbi:peptidoglycan-associated lipoprotein Pal [Sphingomonas solaris]|uniref:Peptidoglycan-associated lipoprotein n=1 Tax=Alterirhizorhabdus solaris TaxID=2529389 RepID=A0A558QYU8_9SPHN|nr:peptidoglycan-associated lipoprotein Pal [Sphingomonas solaris]TVV72310.1 peptidoglycan-associated lipoprotein Pal [Sphingomonas solaris]